MTGSALALAARLIALAALGLAWMAPSLWPPTAAPRTVFLLDLSASMPAAEVEALWQRRVAERRELAGDVPLALAFGANATWLGGTGSADLARARQEIDAGGTDLAAAIDVALARTPPVLPNAFVLYSDGWATSGDTLQALEAARRAGVAIYWENPADTPPRPWIRDVQTAPRGRVAEALGVTVELAGSGAQGAAADVEVQARLTDVGAEGTDSPRGELAGPPVEATVVARAAPGASAVTSLELVPRRAGRFALELRLIEHSSGRVLDSRVPAAIVEIDGPGSLLYVGHGDAPLLRSLRAGGLGVEVCRADAFEGRPGLATYQVIVLDDVPVTDPDAPIWRALDTAVRERGTGLLVLGGPRSFGSGAYRGTRLEALLPVTAQRAKPDDEAAVLFLLDKSGSMESSVHGVDRLAYAREAALETLRVLPEGDRASVLAFDVSVTPVAPFDAADRVAAGLDAHWTLRASGGTRLRAALDAALTAFAGESAHRKLLVIVTDGFVGEEALDEEIEALGRAHIDVVAIAIGSDAEVAGLEALLRPVRGHVLRVAETAELPRLMRAAVAGQRAPIARGPQAVRVTRPMEFLSRPIATWPTIDAYAVTRARAPQLVKLESAEGDPVLAIGRLGLGRVAALPGGLGAWSGRWIDWADWGYFSGALIGWLRSPAADPRLALRLADRPGELGIRIDATDGRDWWRGEEPRLDVRAGDGRTWQPPLRQIAAGRYEADVPATGDGLYRVTAGLGEGRAVVDHLRPGSLELARRGTNPEVETWLRQGLLQPWPRSGFDALLAPAARPERPSRLWLLVALTGFLSAVLVDCGGVLRRSRRRA